MPNLKKFWKSNPKEIFKVKKLSSMVNDFLIKWLFIPGLFFSIFFSLFWISIEIREIKEFQLYYARDISQHVKLYLQNCKDNINHAEFHLENPSFIAERISQVAGADLSFNAICLLDNNMRTVKSVPENSFKGDFTGLINKKNTDKEFFLTSPYYSIQKNKTSVAMLRKARSHKGYILAELNLSGLDSYIKTLTSSIKNGSVFITDSYGNLISHSNTKLVNSQANFGETEVIKKIKTKEAVSGFYWDKNELKLMSCTKIPSAQWIVVLEQNALSILNPFLASGIAIIAVIFILFFVFILQFNKRLHKSVVLPVSDFAKKIDIIKKSNGNIINFSQTESPKSEPFEELSELNKSFSRMQEIIIKREKDLKESEEKYKGIVEDNPSLICSFLSDGTITFANYAYCRYFNKTPEDLIGFNFLELLPQEEREPLLSTLSTLTSESPIRTSEHHVIDSQGRLRWHRWTDRAIFDNNGKIAVFQAIGEDITEKKINEEKLAAERERLAVTLRSIGDGVITTDTKGKIVLLNKVAENLTGWTLNEAKGKDLPEVFNIIHEETELPHENPVEKVLSTGEIVELENHTVLISKTGKRRVIADSGAPIKDMESKTIGVVLVFRDMTEKKKMQETLEKSSKLESLGVLAGGIAHDFNNLLGGIFGYIDLALELSSEENVKEFLRHSMDAMERAKNLTGQLLTFSKGGAPIKEPGSLFPFIKKTADFALSGSNIKCSFIVPEDLYICNFDKNQIGQVIDNLVINAKQAMPSGGILNIEAQNTYLNTHPVLSPGHYVKISFKDSGHGIPLNIKAKIFDPFFTTKEKGHGIGLTTSYSILEKHGGTIEVESEMNKGSIFHIYLPAEKNEYIKQQENNIINHTGEGIILVIDDEEILISMTSSMLETLGYKAVGKNRAEDAINYFKETKSRGKNISAIICDLTIPGGMGGVEAVSEIRKIDQSIPVFVASGYSEDPVMTNPLKYGFTASIPKPYKRSELAKLLKSYLDKNNY